MNPKELPPGLVTLYYQVVSEYLLSHKKALSWSFNKGSKKVAAIGIYNARVELLRKAEQHGFDVSSYLVG